MGIQELSGLTNEEIDCIIRRYCWIVGKARKGPRIKRKGAEMVFLVQDYLFHLLIVARIKKDKFDESFGPR